MIMRIDDEIYVHGYLDEIRQDKVIIRNEGGYFGTVVDELVEAIPKDQYKARLKADMVAMLTEIQLEVEELKNEPACCHHYKRGVNWSSDIIQQKINALKENTDGNDY